MRDEERVLELVMACVDLDDAQRSAYLDAHCGSTAMRAEVEMWLQRDIKTWVPAADDLAQAVEFMKPLEEVVRQPGDLIDRFELVERIAEGGQGVVWRARQKDIDRDAAVKILRPHRKGSEAAKRFHRETAVLARVSHPAIAQIYARGAQDIDGATELPWFAMEFVPGETTLIEFCGDTQAPVGERLDLFIRVCDAVAHSHALGVIHRDLKPDNILVDPSGHPKVIDFGAARDLQSERSLTTAGAIIGTLDWASPEQIQGDLANVGPRTDVYALGAVLHLLVTGHKLVSLNSFAEVRTKIIERTPRPASRFLPSLPRELDWIIGKATEPDPSRRYTGVNELIDDIRRHLKGQPILAAPPSVGYVLSRFVHRHVAITAVTFVSLVLLSALGIFGWKTALAEQDLRGKERVAREEASEAKGEARENLVDALLADAETHEAAGRWNAAIDVLRHALKEGPDDPLAVQLSIARNLIANLQHAEAAVLLDHVSELPEWAIHKDLHALLRGLTALVDDEEHDLFPYYIEASVAPGTSLEPADVAFARGLIARTSRESIARFSEALELDPTHYFARSARALTCLLIDEIEIATVDAAVLAETIPADRMVVAFRLNAASSRADDATFDAALRDVRDTFSPSEFTVLATAAHLLRSTEMLISSATRGENYQDVWRASVMEVVGVLAKSGNGAHEAEVLLGPVGARLPWTAESIELLKRYSGAFITGNHEEIVACLTTLDEANSSRFSHLLLAIHLKTMGDEYAEQCVRVWEETLALSKGIPNRELTCLVEVTAARVSLWSLHTTQENRDAAVDALYSLSAREDLSPHLYSRMMTWARQLRHGALGYSLADRWSRVSPLAPSPLKMQALIASDLKHWHLAAETLERARPLVEAAEGEEQLAWLDSLHEKALTKMQQR